MAELGEEEEEAKSNELSADNRAGFKGPFFSMRLGGNSTYLVTQGRFTFLTFFMEIDVSMKAGPPEKGGGIFMYFLFVWQLGSKVLGEIEGHLDLVPFDFSTVNARKAMSDVSLSMGITIKPFIFNEVMVIIEPVLKLVISIALGLAVLAVEIAQRVLDIAARLLEAGRKVVRQALRSLDYLEKVATRELNWYDAKEEKNRKAEAAYYVSDELDVSDCKKRYKKVYGTGCVVVDGWKQECSHDVLTHEELPKDCDVWLARLQEKESANWKLCCTWWRRIARVLLVITIAVIRAIVFLVLLIPRSILLIAELALTILQAIVNTLEYLLKLAVCAVTRVVNAGHIVNRKGIIRHSRFQKWLWARKTKVCRIYEIGIGGFFKIGEVEISAKLDFVFLGRRIDLNVVFSLSVHGVIAAIADTVKDLVVTLLGDAITCVDEVKLRDRKSVV